ncbi:14231_t:CDS:2, partial [Racocetra fulgida]
SPIGKDKNAHNKEIDENAKERKKQELECEAEKENVIKEVEQKPQKAKAKKVEDLEVPPDIKSMFLKKPSLRQTFNVPQELVEMHVALLNAIIRDKWISKGKNRQIVPLKVAVKSNMDNEEEDSDSEDDTYSSREILKKLEQKWDKKLISLKDGRKVNIVAKTSAIHSHIENCVEKLTELNKEKNGIIKKKRQILSSFTEISKGNIPSESISETNTNEITLVNITANDLMTRKHKLEEEQAEEEIEIEKRKYAFPRTTPLGYDRFYNKYYYFDCIGEAVGERYGAGRIFVEIPSAHDLQAMTEKEEQRFSKRRKVEDIDCNLGSDNQA